MNNVLESVCDAMEWCLGRKWISIMRRYGGTSELVLNEVGFYFEVFDMGDQVIQIKVCYLRPGCLFSTIACDIFTTSNLIQSVSSVIPSSSKPTSSTCWFTIPWWYSYHFWRLKRHENHQLQRIGVTSESSTMSMKIFVSIVPTTQLRNRIGLIDFTTVIEDSIPTTFTNLTIKSHQTKTHKRPWWIFPPHECENDSIWTTKEVFDYRDEKVGADCINKRKRPQWQQHQRMQQEPP